MALLISSQLPQNNWVSVMGSLSSLVPFFILEAVKLSYVTKKEEINSNKEITLCNTGLGFFQALSL